jgi:hypothetical protein
MAAIKLEIKQLAGERIAAATSLRDRKLTVVQMVNQLHEEIDEYADTY